MATDKQIAANRRNAQKSTGPRSPEGKSLARFNALKSGIHAQSQVIPGEDAGELETLTAEFHQEYRPATPSERVLVDALIAADWQLRRLRRVEAQLWQYELDHAKKSSYFGLDPNAPLGDVFNRSREPLTLLQRRLDAAERSFYRALRELKSLRAARPPADEPSEPAEEKPASENSASFLHLLLEPPPLPEDPALLPISGAPEPAPPTHS